MSVSSAPAASAMGCNVAHRYVAGQVASPVYEGSPLRTGPAEVCGIKGRTVGWVHHPNALFKHCWIKNDYGNVWWYGSIETYSGRQEGWMFAGNMTAGYSGLEARYRCF